MKVGIVGSGLVAEVERERTMDVVRNLRTTNYSEPCKRIAP